MKKSFLLFIAIAFASLQVMAQVTWTTDPAHSSVNFTIKHSGISLVPGKFEKFDGTLETNGDDFTNAHVVFSVDVSSVNTSVPRRDDHLRSADFFEVEKYPYMKFESTGFVKNPKKENENDTYTLNGNLTIKDVTRPVSFKVKHGGTLVNDRGKKHGFTAKTTIDRTDYNINYDPTGSGVAKDVNIVIYLQFRQAQ